MKHIFVIILFVISSNTLFAQPGLYAGGVKKLVGKSCKEDTPDKLLKPYKYTGGYLLDDSREEFEVWISQYQKGNIHLVVMFALDALNHNNKVLDILELKLPDANTFVQSGTCSINNEFSIEIIATERKNKILHAWRANRDKLRFQKMDKANTGAVNCNVEGAD